MKSQIFVGVDVSKHHLDVAIRPSRRHFVVSNDDQGVSKLVRRLTTLKPRLIVLEASGGYEALVLTALGEAQLPVRLINPQMVRHFAGATGRMAKTDKIDAQVLAEFAEKLRPEPQPLADEALLVLRATLQRRAQVVKMIGQEDNRLEKTRIPSVRRDIEKHLAWLKDRRDDLDRELKDQIRRSPCWQDQDRLQQRVPGIGRTISLAILARLPELGTLSSNKLAALVGVAPFNRDSGQTV